jgi:acetyltransferase
VAPKVEPKIRITVNPPSNLHHLFNPSSIAVVGASNKPGKMGNLFIRRLAAEFRGALYAVNPSENEIAGITAHRTIEGLPDRIDVLISLVPAARLMTLVESCRKGQVRFLLAIPSGFAEVSEEGSVLQQRLTVAARDRGMRVVGPNIVGMMNGVIGLNASMMPELPPGGQGLSCLTQSGGFGMALSMYALDHDVRVAKFCDLGNSADLDVPEVLGYLADDPDTKVVGLFLESIRDQAGFLRALEKTVANKPVILALVGVTSAGRRASLAHLGISAGIAAFEHELPKSIIRADTGLDLLHCAKALMWQRRARGRRVGILTGTGGIGAEIADLALGHGLEVPSFSPRLHERLREHLPYYASVQNPVDCTPIWWDYHTIYPHVLDALAQSGEVDLVIVSVTDVAATLPQLVTAIAAWAQQGQPIPIVVYWGARHRDFANMQIVQRAAVPCYQSTRESVRMAAALAYSSAPNG